VLLWLAPDGPILGKAVEKTAAALLDLAATELGKVMGKGAPPSRLRVASSELAEALRRGHPSLETVCAPTPELDLVVDSLHEYFDEHVGPEPSYLAPDITPETIAAFFGVTAALYRAAPWAVIRSDQHLVSLTIEELGVRDAVVSVIGQMGQSMGVLVFATLDDFDAFLAGAEDGEAGIMPTLAPHVALSFEPRSVLPPALAKEVKKHRWGVAGPKAYPWLAAIDADLVTRPPTAREVTLFHALSVALARMVGDKAALRHAFEGGPPVTQALTVATPTGEVHVTLRAPLQPPPTGVLGELWKLENDGEDADDERKAELDDELIKRFVASDEAKGRGEAVWCRQVLDLAWNYVGATAASLDAGALDEVLFTYLPRKVMVDASDARAIVEECRAFFGFVAREFSHRPARACLRLLDDEAVDDLEEALADDDSFGMAKSFVMAGSEAGFDMSTQEGIDEWLRVNRKALDATRESLPRPPREKPARAKRNKAKAARKARKKNR
jgi:hypothetical protein